MGGCMCVGGCCVSTYVERLIVGGVLMILGLMWSCRVLSLRLWTWGGRASFSAPPCRLCLLKRCAGLDRMMSALRRFEDECALPGWL